jgi:amino acid adenylation domain-containing protein/non-ribosomal peptide synthase protein (TIGR01720 family)
MSNADKLSARRSQLSPERRALLEKLKRGAVAETAESRAIPRRADHGPAPLSFAQQRLWFLDQLVPGSPAYTIPAAVRLTGALGVSALAASVAAIIARHDALRTTFTANDGTPLQVVGRQQVRPHMPLLDLRGVPADMRADAAQRLIDAEARTPFDLARGPLLRTALLRLADDDHILLIALHHIIADGWSVGIMIRELATLYTAFAGGQALALPELPIQYADYAIWQRDWLQSTADQQASSPLQTQLAYWRRSLANASTILELPTDHPRPAIQSFRGAKQFFTLGALDAQLRALSQREDVTLFMTLLAAFYTLLYRYTGQDDILVGTPIANRTRVETEGLIGLFANTLVLRGDLAGNPSFRELARRVRTATLGAYAHQDLPFEQLVEELQPERDMSRNPLFQVMFVLQNTPGSALELPNLTLQSLPSDSGAAKFDWWLAIEEAPGQLFGILQYNTDLFESAMIARLLGHLRTLLQGIVADPQRRLSELPLLSRAERQQVIEWNATMIAYPQERCLHELIEAQVAQTPDAIALVFDGETTKDERRKTKDEGTDSSFVLRPSSIMQLTYAELDRRANQLARHLRTLGVGPDQPVGLYIERSTELMIALLGIHKAGAAYLPLDPAYPRDRLALMLADAQVQVLLVATTDDGRRTTDGGADPSLVVRPSSCVITVDLHADWPQIARHSDADLPAAATADNLAYLLFTSGSTGLPKGVPISHRAIVNRLRWMQDAYRLTAADRVLQKTPLSFDVSVWECFWPLLNGACVVLARPAGHRDAAYLVQLCDTMQITTLHFVPAMLGVVLAEPGLERCAITRVFCSGEVLPVEFQQRCFARLGAALYNLYGPTEAAVDVTAWRCAPGDARSSVPIGRPVANTQIYVLDPHMQPVPIGVPGELFIGGVQLARGYFARPDLTAERFVPNPFLATNDERRTPTDDTADQPFVLRPSSFARLYKTGDLARYWPDGSIEYLGRRDQQIKLRGFRIELGEIEAVLRQHAAVRDALVLAREDEAPADGYPAKRLVAYIIPDAARESADAPEFSNEQVADWQHVFAQAYSEPAPPDPTFNIAGWTSSYTGQPIPADEMRAWVEATVARIHALRPRRVLEIGCGTGLLLFRIAPGCEHYVGTDFAQAALDHIRQQSPPAHVTLLRRSADDFSELPAASFDLVILNSVVQYFPNVDYLGRVLAGAAQIIAPGGRIFVGDVRSLPLLEAFHTSVELRRAPSALPITQLRQRIRKRVAQEQELVLDPAFFTALRRHIPQLGPPDIQLKRGRQQNELTAFRYDAILPISPAPQSSAEPPWLDWQQSGLTLMELRRTLIATTPALLGIAGVHNARLAPDIAALALLDAADGPATAGELRESLHAPGDASVDPEALWALGDELAYTVAISGSGAPGCFDAVLQRRALADHAAATLSAHRAAPPDDQPLRAYANDPLHEKLTSRLVPALRGHLKEKVPDYMIPAAFVLLEHWPLTPNGKLDRRALPAPLPALPELEGEFVAPRTMVEKMLASIWERVLDLERIGIHNNFFTLGGDSIRSIQIVARARGAGLHLTPRQLFQHQTIAELAAIAQPITSQPAAHTSDQHALTPLQSWFFAQHPTPADWTEAIWLDIPRELDSARLVRAFQHLLDRHAALRMRFTATATGWRQRSAHPDARAAFSAIDLTALTDAAQERALLTIAARLRSILDPTSGPLVRIARCDRGPQAASRLLLVLHRLVADDDSWRILLADLTGIYAQLSRDEMPALPVQTGSFAHWAERLAAQSSAATPELSFWLDTLRADACRLPLDTPDASRASAALPIILALDADMTQALRHDANHAYRTRPPDLLITALVQALAAQQQRRILLDLDGDGRTTQLAVGLELAHVIGQFATRFPLLLDLDSADTPAAAIKTIKEQLRRVPNQGIGYGALRYLDDSTASADQLRALPSAQLHVSYRDEFAPALGAPFALAPDTWLPLSEPSDARPYQLALDTRIVAGQLRMAWSYDAQAYRRETIARLAHDCMDALHTLLDHCRAPTAGGYTPSDFPLAQLDQQQLDRLLGTDRMIADVYPLAPFQDHMLFQYLNAPKPGLYFVYQVYGLHGQLDISAFERAWQQVVERHAVLRTSFVWQELARPLQVVHQNVQVQLERHDCRGLAPAQQAEQMDDYILSIWRRRFDLSRAPYTRLALFQTSEDAYQFVWSFSYILQDGWSYPLLLKEFLGLYETFCRGQALQLPPSRPYRDDIAWLQQQDLARAEAFWRGNLRGFTTPTPLMRCAPGNAPTHADRYVEESTFLPVATTTALRSLARQQHLTLNTLLQGAWALVLSRYSGADDVVFGSIVSGRPAELDGAEFIVGSLNNLLPVRVHVPAEQTLAAWLTALQAQQVELRQYEYSPPRKVQEWSELPDGPPLYESYLVFENYPREVSRGEHTRRWLIRPGSGVTQTEHPLRLTIWPTQSLMVIMSYYPYCFDSATIARMQSHLQAVLEGMSTRPHCRLGELLALIEMT